MNKKKKKEIKTTTKTSTTLIVGASAALATTTAAMFFVVGILGFLVGLDVLKDFTVTAALDSGGGGGGLVYFVNGLNGRDDNSGTDVLTAWKTIGKANATLRAGDTVYIMAGTYSETIRPENNGDLGAYISYENYQNDEVILKGKSGERFVVNLREKKYVLVRGMKIIDPTYRLKTEYTGAQSDSTLAYADLTGATGCVLEDNIMRGMGPEGYGISLGGYGMPETTESSYNVIRNNTVIGYPKKYDVINPDGTKQNIGLETITLFFNAHHNVIENNYIENGDHDAIYVKGNGDGPTWDEGTENPNHNVIKNNVIKNPLHHSVSEGYGTHDNLWDGNIILESVDSTEDGNKAEGFHLSFSKAIIRNNIVIKSGGSFTSYLQGGIGLSSRVNGGSLYRSVNNSIYNNIFSYNTGPGILSHMAINPGNGICYDYPETQTGNNAFVNNIIVGNASDMDDPAYNGIEISYQSYIDKNCADKVESEVRPIVGDVWRNNIIGTDFEKKSLLIRMPGFPEKYYSLRDSEDFLNPVFKDNISADPGFVDVANNDFHLKEGSAAIDAGAFLTHAVNSGSNSTNLQVEDARYFMDGWGIIEPDTIQIGDSIVLISGIDYEKNIIILNQPMSWEENDGVGLPYSGERPDIGNYERARQEVSFVRGDINADGKTDIADAIETLNYLFLGGREVFCLDSADVDDDGFVTLTDAIYLLNSLFKGGDEIRPPFNECGMDLTDDNLGCEEYSPCF